MGARVLVVEDEPSLLETLAYSLRRQGYDVSTASDGLSAIQVARALKPDMLVLDILLPELDGLEVCRILRRETNVPILMLTARDDEVDKVVGLEIGADDYMTKPFSMRELLARIKAMLRRSLIQTEAQPAGEPNPAKERLSFGDLVVDLRRGEVTLGGQPIRLKPKEYDLLAYMARNRGMALSRDMILEQVWGWDFGGGSRTVDVHIRWLREKLEVDPTNPQRIITVRGIGYRFEG
ncbi:MAG: response regulator [Anaerolineae bacterium]